MTRALIVMAALALSASPAAAQTIKSLQFGAGGNTIAGPGARTVPDAATEVVLLLPAATPLDLCATVVNLSKGGAVVGIQVFDPGMVSASNNAAAGEAATACRKASNQVKVSCAGAEQCQLLWRVDQSR